MATSARWKLNSTVPDLDVTKQTVENAESRARLQIKTSVLKLSHGNNRQYAQALHHQADELCQRGEYESALVLYHRAAIVCPHDSSHSVAARRTAATISSWNNLEKSSSKADAISKATSSHECVALKMRDTSKSFDDLSIITGVLKYLGNHKKTSNKISPALGSLTSKLIRSRTTLKHVNSRANTMLKNLKVNFKAGKIKTSLRLAEDLLTLSCSLEDSCRYKISAYRYLSLIYTTLGRHDRACSNVAMMVRLSKSTNDVVLLSQALVTLGKVHLSFSHLEAAARALENLSIHVDHPVPRAWVHHEIGRCHLETGKYVKALRKATQCRECAEEANSKKWTFHADLLRAQCLVMLGRFAEALEELRIAAKISEEEGDTPTLSYIRDLIEQLNRALREVTFSEESILRRLSPRCKEPELSEGNKAITSSGIRRTTRSKDNDALTSPFYSDCLEDEILDRREIESNSSSVDSVVSCRSKNTNLTYVIDSHTDVSYKDKLDGMRICDDELLSRESYMTFRTCYKESRHSINEDKASVSLIQPIAIFSSNVERCGGQAECETFRISRSCEDERDFDTVTNKAQYDTIAEISHGRSSLTEMKKQDNDEESFVRGAFSNFDVST
ncbi:PREDICTED: tetratricopeptide repeat protein 25-like [Cyphomyrmex costatus]|uniref:Outer dynein arm-docking complex subunit 4 n=1 Tax=Cyphomyrmex costatus TaxID=456900 RepID=A0A195CSM9_9HYME|nr:PREDICTED: tetratricopeptide repeat protein 25-like [Cyphomyrmex costatus]KYN03650.1 Tetratricopeptide repeat protein 25 [Cyphomyrmex costatus]